MHYKFLLHAACIENILATGPQNQKGPRMKTLTLWNRSLSLCIQTKSWKSKVQERIMGIIGAKGWGK